MTPYDTSMKLDFQGGRQMEVEAIYGEPIRAAGLRGAGLPQVKMLCDALRLMNFSTTGSFNR